ncbi:MAG: hypothetical protein ACKOZY_05840 [Flavobacteriales bacterium]
MRSFAFAADLCPADTLILDGEVVSFDTEEESPNEDSTDTPDPKPVRRTIAEQRWFVDISAGITNTQTQYNTQRDGWLTLNEFMGVRKNAKPSMTTAFEVGGTIWHAETPVGELNLSFITGLHFQQYQSTHLVLGSTQAFDEDSILSLDATDGLLLLSFFDVFNPGQFPPIGEVDTIDVAYASSASHIRAFEIPLRIQVISEFGHRGWRWNAQAGVVQRLVQHGYGVDGYSGREMYLVNSKGELSLLPPEQVLPRHVIMPQFSFGIERVITSQFQGRNRFSSLFLQCSVSPSVRVADNADVLMRQQMQSFRIGYRKYF